ncbi:MAG: hypothetical protein LBD11_06850 [Candidatus Peribacteria bacterium]|jgi:hypothetical protein|nr:hypothetical protein [Candidatus Peribacteria bacterium]
MQHKQNAVIQRCVVGLAGVFSVIGLALFWRNDVAEAQGSDGQDSNQVWGVDNRVEYLSTLTFLVSGNNTLEGGVWKAYSGATSTRGAILATGEVRVGSSNTMASAAKYAFI